MPTLIPMSPISFIPHYLHTNANADVDTDPDSDANTVFDAIVNVSLWRDCKIKIESHCIPVLTYSVEVIHVADADVRRQMRVAHNSVSRRIFNYRPWQSVLELQLLLLLPTWEK